MADDVCFFGIGCSPPESSLSRRGFAGSRCQPPKVSLGGGGGLPNALVPTRPARDTMDREWVGRRGQETVPALQLEGSHCRPLSGWSSQRVTSRDASRSCKSLGKRLHVQENGSRTRIRDPTGHQTRGAPTHSLE